MMPLPGSAGPIAAIARMSKLDSRAIVFHVVSERRLRAGHGRPALVG